MALRSLDNALPAALERPKKSAKVAGPRAEPPHDPSINNENAAPMLKVADQSIEYTPSHDLLPLPDPESKIMSILQELDSKDWMEVCEALNDVRRLALHHSSHLLPILDNVMVVMVKSIKNPRSALCKTCIMASSDIFGAFGHHLLSSTVEKSAFDHLLLQLLLKASQDKKFVCEEAEKALETMATSMSPLPPLLNKLRSYVNHTNPRVRAKATVTISKCVSKMDIDIMREFGLAILLQVAAEMLNDRLPEAREAARSIINSIHSGGFSDEAEKKADPDNEGGASTVESWEDFCSSNLPPISALSVAKIVSQ